MCVVSVESSREGFGWGECGRARSERKRLSLLEDDAYSRRIGNAGWRVFRGKRRILWRFSVFNGGAGAALHLVFIVLISLRPSRWGSLSLSLSSHLSLCVSLPPSATC